MPNCTRVTYLHRDEYNNKYGASVDFAGELTDTERGQLYASLEDGKYFLPTQVGLPHLVVEVPEDLDGDSDDWAPWHELVSIETLEEDLAEPGEFAGDGDLPDGWFDESSAPELAQFVAAFPTSSSQWQESAAIEAVLQDLNGG